MKRKERSKESTLWESTPAVSTGHSDPAVRGTVSCSIGAEDTPAGAPSCFVSLGLVMLYNVGFLHSSSPLRGQDLLRAALQSDTLPTWPFSLLL